MNFLALRRNIWDNIGRDNFVYEPRVELNRQDPLNHYSEIEFLRNFRLTKDSANELANFLEDELVFRTERSRPMTPLQQLCVTLAFLANGSFIHVAGELMGVKKSCAFYNIHNTVRVLCGKIDAFITLPTANEMRNTATELFNRFKIPNVVLRVDFTCVQIQHHIRVIFIFIHVFFQIL